MAGEHATIIPQLLAENEQALLRDWIESQKKSGALRSGQISEAELTENSRRLLSALCGGAATGQFADITAPVWDQSRTVLEDVSRSRATLGLSPADTGTFVFSLKEPLFALLRQKVGKDPDRLAHEMWAATLLLDKLGLYTVEALPEEPRRRDRAPAAGTAGAVHPGGQAVGGHPRPAADRHPRQRAHPDRHGEPAAADRRPPAPRSPSSTSPACRRSTRWSRSTC